MKVYEILNENVGDAIEKLLDQAGLQYQREASHIKVQVGDQWVRIKTLAQAQEIVQSLG